MANRLSVRNISKTFDSITALNDVSFDVREGEILALLGENGAGKSTLSAIVAGIHRPDSGAMEWEGSPYLPASPGHAIATGVGLIHQETNLLPDLTIYENIFLGRLITKRGMVNAAAMKAAADAQLARLGLRIPSTTPLSKLSIAAMQQVEIAKALTLHSKLLILDEPTAALGGEETELLFLQLKKLKAEGVSFIYISHRLDEIPQIADRVVVMRDGCVVAKHDDVAVPSSQLVSEMVGRTIDAIFPTKSNPQDATVLEVKGIKSKAKDFKNIDFSVRAGEILGIAGIVGAGRSELARCIAGVDHMAEGTMSLDGLPARFKNPKEAIDNGLVFIPEDRKYEGLILEQDISNNLLLGNFDKMTSRGWCLAKTISQKASTIITRFHIKGFPQQQARHLSGGNQQKVIIGRWISRDPKVVILDEPTRGIDVGARHEIYAIINKLASEGAAIIVISSDLEEVLGLSHRVLVLCNGVQTGILERETLTRENVMELATRLSA